jgi:hypothetical protein
MQALPAAATSSACARPEVPRQDCRRGTLAACSTKRLWSDLSGCHDGSRAGILLF